MPLQPANLFYGALTAFVSVVLVMLIRKFGKLPISLIGPDLNLLTYGFLWDTAVKALRNVEYWPRFQPLMWNINRPTTLLVIALLNFILLGFNMKLAHKVENMAKGPLRNWLLRPCVTAVGVFSLIAFLWIQASWEGF